MNITRRMRRLAATALGVSALSVGLVVGGAGTASAAVPHELTICAQGNYPAYAWIQSSGIRTVTVRPGGCTTVRVYGDTTMANAWAVPPSGYTANKLVKPVVFNPWQGKTIGMYGTYESPWLVTW
ncbi:hypothetical protein [Streptomyces sp. PSKA30]|uniref:hypothetical protein n=1 Tax=Streptomyces sp. PSKA30 TaxID=2874597 RepID=UPI001CD15902|nr:hypothetical protein [Streptomyces sp. PSKA30]MBZ9641919.1 hypothetical protein [Streptomyces sp. PSKA30]